MKNKGVVAAGHIKTAEAAKIILDEGGNAFDAVIAAGLASAVSEYCLTSLAGGGFLLAHTKEGQNTLFDFFTQTPKNRNLNGKADFFPIEVDFGGATQEFHIGLASMATPGCLAGYFHVQKKLGKLPFSVVAEPAIKLAREGMELNEFQRWCSTLLKPILTREEYGKNIFEKDGQLLEIGAHYKMLDFANTLETFTKEGIDDFYKGEIAKKIVADCESRGGYLTMEDFENFQVVERDPLLVRYNGNAFITNPPPSSGGELIAFSLELLEKVKVGQYKHGSFEHLKILSDVMRFTNVARGDDYDSSIYNSDVIEKFLSDEHLAKYREMLGAEINRWGSTTHVSVVDAEGNAASMTTSNGEGSSYFAPGTGIMMNNMLGEEDLNPNGFHSWPTDVRMSSMMSPTMVLKDGQPEIVLGSGGSNRIRTAILQVISNMLDFKMPVQEAVEAFRIHWERNAFNIEPGFGSAVVAKLKDINRNDDFKEFPEKNMFFGGVHTVTCCGDDLEGAGDDRRSGVCIN